MVKEIEYILKDKKVVIPALSVKHNAKGVSAKERTGLQSLVE